MPVPQPGGRLLASGSGFSPQAAEEAARYEAIERYSLHFHSGIPLIRARWEDVAAHAIHPSQFLLLSDRQLRTRKHPTHEGEWDWVEGHWVSEDGHGSAWDSCLIPAACCYLSYPLMRGAIRFGVSSNGCAAGNNFEDAAVRAFLELVERDAIAIWWYNRLRRPSAPIPGGLGNEIATELGRQGLRLELLDLTTDLGIPVVAAVAHNRVSQEVRFGFGAAWQYCDASLHAIAELCQSLGEPQFHVGGGPVHSEPWLMASGESRIEKSVSPTVKVGLHACAHTVTRAGLRMIVIDQTNPETETPVARVVVPGLRPALPRFAPGRLYEVPLRLGWTKKRTLENGLNPVPFTI
ncbi:MAG: YcaO-like family protein [Bryobacterales bacterium]|nr:YcaO-like family protein [Bryobacterales bacterium]